jgi:hypothetical protein
MNVQILINNTKCVGEYRTLHFFNYYLHKAHQLIILLLQKFDKRSITEKQKLGSKLICIQTYRSVCCSIDAFAPLLLKMVVDSCTETRHLLSLSIKYNLDSPYISVEK